MARKYIRPELSAQDLKVFQRAKCVAINPVREDILKLLAKAELRCSKNTLSAEEVLSAYDRFIESDAPAIFVGDHTCDKRLKFPLQCTVFQLVRLTDSIVGLICDRQHVLPGKKSKPPITVGPDGVFSGRSPIMRLEAVLSYFWPCLSDTDIDDMHQLCTTHVMSALVPMRLENDARQEELRKQRRANIEELFRGAKPEFTTEFVRSCQLIARELKNDGRTSIAWSQLKKQYPSYAMRHKVHFLWLLKNAHLSTESLDAASNQTDFDSRITTWRGECRIFDTPQLVLQIRNIPIHRHFSKASLAHNEFSDLIKAQARKSSHPATENTVGWLRVHIDDGNRLCFVDEVQSDAIELALEYTQKAGYEAVANSYIAECNNWHLHAFASVCQWAEKIGYKAAIHSKESATAMECMTRSERKWVTYYGSIIKQFGLRKESTQNYQHPIYVGDFQT